MPQQTLIDDTKTNRLSYNAYKMYRRYEIYGQHFTIKMKIIKMLSLVNFIYIAQNY